ncbi:double-strand break repair helicase AddA [Pseudorhodobacter sp.]|uniref:double-strand break repair helicase AddA n=1 Tax=Pseudorhodobacter sp. TaxID=1934400 RepID=UPI00264A192B|nr:double-strand break repair helicase AddA [Pseudorhodobacter sp.]MDN5785812.1 double-strand break repair helicase AddA [Pseudorhodobacter sp.]
MIRNAASERQVQSANPSASTWLSANAGSGKTRVLTDRVARMLLSGVDPGRILCLTYTKAAASEMQNRLFARLGDWAMKEDAALKQALAELGVQGAVDAARLARARQLFARAIETPGGLRIQTIHSFCASLLRRFPLEAKVSPQFTEMDDRAGALLRDEILDEMADSIAPDVIAALAAAYTGEDFGGLAHEVAGRRAAFNPPLSEQQCRELFDVPEGQTEAEILAQVFLGGEAGWLAEAVDIIAEGSANDVKAADRLIRLNLATPDMAALTGLEGVLLTGASAKLPFSAKLGTFPTKATQARLGPMQDPLEDLMQRVESARSARVALIASQRSTILHRFAAVFLPEYATRKQRRGWLDFDDLITHAKALLTDPSVAQWVLFRLDGGIDHILVDEAQDTSPDQWAVIELLANEFTSGLSAREEPRTIFVVGDKKQSIYSFQGADVDAFDGKRAEFKARLDQIGAGLQELQLEHSFRSSHAILRLVDLTFDERRQKGLGGEVKHIAFFPDMPGRVDLWPVIEKSSDPKPENWYDPVDLMSEEHHAARLGRQVADTIKGMIDRGAQIPTDGGRSARAVHAGDFLILVRRRSDIFSAIIQACKTADLPIAGADRLKLGAELAVRDLAALLAFLATPEDDLSLAACLRSPLFAWTEQQLYSLAQPRNPGAYLWETLRNSAEHGATIAVLRDMRKQADFLRPYDLIERILTRHGGRRKLLARLGAEAEDGIDELLSQALAYESNDVPSLTGFLGWLETDEVEVKRQMDSAGGRIRVMTVHGAKGLEAPIVILPDTARHNAREHDEVFLLPAGPVWKLPSAESPEPIAEARALRKAKAEAEAMRLLYVAMTRAQSWLIVAAAGDIGKDKSDDEEASNVAWYRMIQDAMVAAGATATPGGGLQLVEGTWPPDIGPAPAQTVASLPLPSWVSTAAAEAIRPPQPLNPSDLGGAKALPGDFTPDDENRAAMDRGTRLHLLLEHLPEHDPVDWARIAAALLPGAADLKHLLEEAKGVLLHPGLREIFSAGTVAECPITAQLDGRPLIGTIDRLLVRERSILAVDFKSNLLVPRTVAEVPEGLLRQMGAYEDALTQIYPNHAVTVALLWTRTAQLMPIDAEIVRSALQRTTLP